MAWFKSDGKESSGARRGNYNVDLLKAQISDNISSAVMMVDRDFIVTYVNQPTKDLLSANFDEFRKLWPSFNPETIVGTCIDTFHKNPRHQRGILSDPSKLPMKTASK